MPEPPTKKFHPSSSRNGIQRSPSGSAIVFWHEIEGAPPYVRAIAVRDLEPVEASTYVTEKTVCRTVIGGVSYNCIVVWIEEDKTPDELTRARLQPSACEKTYEDKGYRWAAEMGVLRSGRNEETAVSHNHDDVRANWVAPETVMEPRSSSWESVSDHHDDSFEREKLRKRKNPAPAAFLRGGSISMAPEASLMQETFAAFRRFQQPEQLAANQPTKTGSTVEGGAEAERNHTFSSSTSLSSPAANEEGFDLSLTQDEILDHMLLQSTWKKALKLGMKKVFSIEELVTSVPTERGARMSKNGKKALDQDRLNIVKALVERYCVRKDIYPITNDQIHAELGGILFSIRESHNPQPRQTKSKAPKMPKMHMYGEPRAGKRKTGPPPTRAYPFKLPSFTTALDLSDMRSSHIS